ncbi:EamA family transporter [Microvirga sp. KLBC 81]|uniref:DMT family transporter n=1 Tax=Microvirga sp. KLBC 81 TaxID=1862707 RepID=UPI000D513E1A|nr:EamA family transporter [Microvirga sp. KLBC 81]PVE24817.1 EamA family transporter [Microvirga sp. KLBC 81]
MTSAIDTPAKDAKRPPYISYAMAAAGATLFATKGILIKLAYARGIDAETTLALRMILALPFYLVIGTHAVMSQKAKGQQLPETNPLLCAFGVGLIGYWISSYLDFKGLEYISAHFERLILFTYPLFVVLFGAAFFRQPIKPKALLAFAVSYAGLALLFAQNFSTFGASTMTGALYVLAAAVTFALYQLLAKPLIMKIGPQLFTCIAMGAAGVAVILQFLATHPFEAILVSPSLWGLGLALAFGATVLPSFFLSAALKQISAQANATIGMLSPVVTIVLAMAVLGDAVSGTDWLGAALVILGIGWFTLSERKG